MAMNPNDDKQSIERVLKGDTQAYSQLVERYSGRVFGVVVRIVGCAEDAEEVTQDVFIKAFNALHGYNHKSSFSTWLYRIAYNTAISKVRKKHEPITDIDDHKMALYSMQANDNEIDNKITLEADIEKLAWALEQLPPQDRGLITMFYIEDRSISELAEITSLSESNIKVKLHRTRHKLYTLMTQM